MADDWDERHPAYMAGVREGREQGAKHMRGSIEAYLGSLGIEHPPLPKTIAERKEFEREFDGRVVESARIRSASISADGMGEIKLVGNDDPKPEKPPGDDPRAGHETVRPM